MELDLAKVAAALGSKELQIISLETVIDQQKQIIDALSKELQIREAEAGTPEALATNGNQPSEEPARIPVTDDPDPGDASGLS